MGRGRPLRRLAARAAREQSVGTRSEPDVGDGLRGSADAIRAGIENNWGGVVLLRARPMLAAGSLAGSTVPGDTT
jgi:hypothetical protein